MLERHARRVLRGVVQQGTDAAAHEIAMVLREAGLVHQALRDRHVLAHAPVLVTERQRDLRGGHRSNGILDGSSRRRDAFGDPRQDIGGPRQSEPVNQEFDDPPLDGGQLLE